MEELDILVVEDNDDDIMILRRHFSRLRGSYRVDLAYTAAEALAKVQARPYHLVLLDNRLPDLEGETLIGRMRAARATQPVVMLTGQGDERLAVKVMKAGAWDYLRKDDLNPMVLTRMLRTVMERARLEGEVRAMHAELRELAIRDGLTGLCNHRHFQSLLQREFARARRYHQPLGCLMLDLDHFKRINDTRGHPCGDQVLRHIAGVLREVAREVDVIARYGGEEFVLLLPLTDAAGARRVGQRICESVAATPVDFDEHHVRVTVSVGGATDGDRGVRTAADLVKRADAALYQAKRAGRNRVCMAGSVPITRDLDVGDVTAAVARRRSTSALVTVVEYAERRHGREGHGVKVTGWLEHLRHRLGLDTETFDGLTVAARLASLGRDAIPDAIWNTPGPLLAEDWVQVRDYPALSEDVICRLDVSDGVAEAIRHHRERWDGAGYPDGLVGEEIPHTARILGLVDAWHALISPRPWRPAFSEAAARSILLDEAGGAFDPELVKIVCAELATP